MNKQDQFEEDLLRKYLGPKRIEKAPDAFTVKTMTRISLNTESQNMAEKFYVKYAVPVVSGLITVILIIAAAFIPAGNTDTIGSAVLKFFSNIDFTLPQINIITLPDISLPAGTPWIFIMILALFFFDRALTGIFYKEK